jgi:hypothetical protein
MYVVIHGFCRFEAASEKVGRCGCLPGGGFGLASPCFSLVQLLIEAMGGRVQVADNTSSAVGSQPQVRAL